MTQAKRSRNPAGIVKAKPIALRLMPDERAEAIRIANEQGYSLSAHGRECYLLGKKILLSSASPSPSPSATPPRKRPKRGGGGSPPPRHSLSLA